MIKSWLLAVFGPSSKFNIGDSVQPINGDQELMVVVEIEKERSTQGSLIRCQWYDPEEKKNKLGVFAENELEPFDWYHPKKRAQ